MPNPKNQDPIMQGLVDAGLVYFKPIQEKEIDTAIQQIATVLLMASGYEMDEKLIPYLKNLHNCHKFLEKAKTQPDRTQIKLRNAITYATAQHCNWNNHSSVNIKTIDPKITDNPEANNTPNRTCQR